MASRLTTPSLHRVYTQLDGLDPAGLTSAGDWQAARIFDHLAQGVEFSLTGYPQLRGPLFRHTVGRVAFRVFRARGKMRHGLNEVIPGEVVREAVTAEVALDRLKAALEAFDAHEGPLAPHFAYGALGKSDFALAHALHVDNHFEELTEL